MENPPKKKATIYEIAKALDIDSSTVSRALQDSARVAQKTRDKVQKKAQELGYRPNLLASNLRQNKSNTIGVVIPRVSRHFFSTTIAGIEEAAFAAGYNVIISQSLEKLKREQKIISNFVSNRVDGVLISISLETNEGAHLEYLQEIGIPLVFFDRHFSGLENSIEVIIDDLKGAYNATKKLIDQGSRKIAHFTGPQMMQIYKNRLNGYRLALEENDLVYDPDLVVCSNLMKEDGFEVMEKLYEMHPDIDGLFSANDEAAFGAIKYLKSKGRSIPQDVAVIGFSNDPLSEVIEPSLTSIDQSGFEMGKIACEVLIKNIESRSFEGQTVILKSRLIERESSRRKNPVGAPVLSEYKL